MPVRVARADRDQRDSRAARGEELRIGVPAAVVRHLEDVGPQVRPVGDQPRLGLGAEVSGEQDRQVLDGDSKDEGEVVGLSRRDGPLGGRGEDVHVHLAHRSPVAWHQDGPSRTGTAHRSVECAGPVVSRREGAGGHHPDLAATQGTGQTAHVVRVQV